MPVFDAKALAEVVGDHPYAPHAVSCWIANLDPSTTVAELWSKMDQEGGWSEDGVYLEATGTGTGPTRRFTWTIQSLWGEE